jgi:hypothetical protein
MARAGALFCAIALLLVTRPAAAAELALLRNGFTIRHQHHLVMGTTTRLYFGADDSSFTDVPTAKKSPLRRRSYFASTRSGIDAASPPIRMPLSSTPFGSLNSESAKTASPFALNEVVNSASATYHLDP